MKISRRELSMLVPAVAAAQTPAPKKEKPVLVSQTWEYKDLPVKPNGQNEGRAVFDGLTHSAYPVELHMTRLGPGQQPHPPHHHVNEEVLMLKNGQLDATFGGKTTRIGPGSIIYIASNEEHGWKNNGTEPAEYWVIALGPKS
jgi:mannose-6-phosphate isomerase-like protein (cupin superfamily)